MGTITKPHSFTTGGTILASQHNSNFDTIYTEFNGNIEAANLASGAVTENKLAAGAVTNAKVDASAAIALSKLAALTANRATETDANGEVGASSVTSTELGYVSGVTSAIQTQLDGKSADGGKTGTLYSGFVPDTSDGSNSEILPSGWSSSRSGNLITITHNLNNSGLVIVVGASDRSNAAVMEDYAGRTSNAFEVVCWQLDGTANNTSGFHFLVTVA